MFQVSYFTESGLSERHVTKAFWLAKLKAKEALGRNCRSIKITRVRIDLWVMLPNGSVEPVAKRVPIKSALRWSKDWSEIDNQNGVILWPSGSKMPLE